MNRRVLLVSNHDNDRRYWNGVCYDFVNVIAGIEKARLVAPPLDQPLKQFVAQLAASKHQRLREYAFSLGKGLIGLTDRRSMEHLKIEEDYDLCAYVLYFPHELHRIQMLRNWRQRSGIAVAFLIEGWSGLLEEKARDLALLDQFDHVFAMNRDAIDTLQKFTKTPVTFLPTGVDCDRACPIDGAGLTDQARRIDVLSLGRQLPRVHARMIELAGRRNLFYHYDVWTDMQAQDWERCRRFNADLARRSRYSIVWDPSIEPPAEKVRWMAADRPISSRYFEAGAGGAVILGSRSLSPTFDELFDWPDALVPIAPDGSDLECVLDTLDADPGRTGRIRQDNVTNALRRHDWSYRWRTILETLGLSLSDNHLAREQALRQQADALEDAARRAPVFPVLAAQ